MLNLLIDRRSEAIRKGQRQTVCQGVWASWHLKLDWEPASTTLPKKMSKPTLASCSLPSLRTLPVWEVRERDMGQFWESIVALSSETEYLTVYNVQAATWAIHVPHCLQTTGLSGWVILPQLMVRWWHQHLKFCRHVRHLISKFCNKL